MKQPQINWNVPYVQWVVKISKKCNLRCKYCYEYPFLANSQRMQLSELDRMFKHIADYYRGTFKRMDFVWHGGEPLLIKPEYYRQIAELQHEAFDHANVLFTNSVQTNLTILTDNIIELFKNFFTHIGVSIDLFGDQRINLAGKPSQALVLKNMQRLINEGISFGCITVLSKFTAPHVEEIYHFFEDIDTSFRFLPIYRTGYEHQQDDLELSDVEIVHAFKKAVDLWFASERNIQVQPIQDYVINVIKRLGGNTGVRNYYNKLENEVVYIVDTDGSLYSNADAYDPELCHGNIFQTSLRQLKQSSSYLRAVEAAHQRMSVTCHSCRYHGACSGYFMAEATPEQRFADQQGDLQCSVAKPVQQYVEQILIDVGAVDLGKELLRADILKSKLVGGPPTAFVG